MNDAIMKQMEDEAVKLDAEAYRLTELAKIELAKATALRAAIESLRRAWGASPVTAAPIAVMREPVVSASEAVFSAAKVLHEQKFVSFDKATLEAEVRKLYPTERITSAAVSTAIYELVHRNKLRRVERGLYELTVQKPLPEAHQLPPPDTGTLRAMEAMTAEGMIKANAESEPEPPPFPSHPLVVPASEPSVQLRPSDPAGLAIVRALKEPFRELELAEHLTPAQCGGQAQLGVARKWIAELKQRQWIETRGYGIYARSATFPKV